MTINVVIGSLASLNECWETIGFPIDNQFIVVDIIEPFHTFIFRNKVQFVNGKNRKVVLNINDNDRIFSLNSCKFHQISNDISFENMLNNLKEVEKI